MSRAFILPFVSVKLPPLSPTATFFAGLMFGSRLDLIMRWRVLALASLGVNIVLAVVWLVSAGHSRYLRGEAGFGSSTAATSAQSPTNIVLRPPSFSWPQLQSPPFPTPIPTLPHPGCT